jgi:hypothetical protein
VSSDVLITPPDGPAPLDYQVSNVAEIIPLSVEATIDNSGSGQDVIPVLVFVGLNGVEFARCPAPRVLTGGSATVSWFPRLAQQAAAAPAGSTLPYIFVEYLSNVGLASGAAPVGLNLDPASPRVSWGTDSPAIFDLTNPGGPDYQLTFLENGLYLAFAWLQMPFNVAPAAGAVATVQLTGANQTVAGSDTEQIIALLGGPPAYQAQPSRVAIFNLPAGYGAPPIYSQVNIGQNSTHLSQAFLMELIVFQINKVGNTNF